MTPLTGGCLSDHRFRGSGILPLAFEAQLPLLNTCTPAASGKKLGRHGWFQSASSQTPRHETHQAQDGVFSDGWHRSNGRWLLEFGNTFVVRCSPEWMAWIDLVRIKCCQLDAVSIRVIVLVSGLWTTTRVLAASISSRREWPNYVFG